LPRLLVSGLSRPVDIVPGGDGNARLFVVEQTGTVRIVEGRTLLPAPFLDLTPLIAFSGERGLLGLAFHPEYAANRAFYVFYTALDGALTVARYLRNAVDPRLADPTSGAILLSIPHASFPNHNGGKLAFGPDGYLYISTGDGGGAGDPGNNSQNLASLLGKLLRIAVDGGPGYSIPLDNPHAGNPKCPGTGLSCPEIWAYGLRNPWRYSFDRVNGDLFIGDVGQNAWEEIDYLRAGSPGGSNFGWRVFEGTHCFQPAVGCTLPGSVPPVIEYPHDATGGVAVTGGFRYRGLGNTSLRGRYLYADFSSRRVWTVAPAATAPWSPRVMLQPPVAFGGIGAFGEDHAGELYLADVFNGRIWSLVAPLALSPQQLTFPRTATGATAAPRTVRLTNATGTPFAVTAASTSGDFSIAANGCSSLAGAASCEISVAFSPIVAGARTGELVIQTNYPDNPVFRVALSGNRGPAPNADFDGNGRDDILWRSAGGANLAWLMDGSAVAGSSVRLPARVGALWRIADSGDFDGDGIADLLWRHDASGQNQIWFLRPGGVSRIVATATLADAGWRVAGAGDVDGDGRADIVWRHALTGANRVWLMNGETVSLTVVLDPMPAAWQIAAVGDLDGDGRSDLVWRNTISGENLAWLLNGTGRIGAGALPALADSNWKIAAGGDVNGDGRMDLAWRNLLSGGNRIWLMNGAAVAREATMPIMAPAWALSAAGDYNGDGRADLLWTNAGTGANRVWLMNGTTIDGVRALPQRPAGMTPQ
jgi:glucose/arabinose dehydrogenase